MDILISFCNIKRSEQTALGVLDPSTLAFRIPELPKGTWPGMSITGLAASATHIYAAVQESPPTRSALIIFDSANLELLGFYRFRSVFDVHSLWLSGDCLYVVSSGTDEVRQLRVKGHSILSESVFWRPDPDAPRKDNHHLNAICGRGEDLFVSGFGKRNADGRWGSAIYGFIINISSGQVLSSTISHPHSLLALEDRILYCESAKMAVRELGSALGQTLPGYTRGLCATGTSLFAGTSIGREVSKSTGLINNPAHRRGLPAGRCTVSRLNAQDFSIEDTVDLSEYATEIYDLIPVAGARQWQPRNPLSCRPFDLDKEIVTWIPSGEKFVLVDDEQFGMDELIAGRRRIPFLEKDGCYWGHPEDDDTAVRECERLRRSGANYIVFPWTCFWWLDYYTGFDHYLRSKFRCLLQNDLLLVFDLRE